VEGKEGAKNIADEGKFAELQKKDKMKFKK